MLVVVIFMLAILMLSLTVAAPVVRKEIQRDREVELMHRGKQYARAVKLYYRKFGAYPPNLEALVKTNDVRFLRKKYIDLSTGKEEWKIIRVGQQKTPSIGFFGVPLGAAGATATAGVTGATPFASTSGSSASGPGSSNLNSPAGATGSSIDSSGGASLPSPLNESASSTGLTGQSFGGMPIMGFSPNSPKESILIYRKKNHYNEWEFLYDALADQMTQAGSNSGAIGQPINGMPTAGAGSATGFSLNLNSNGTNGGSNSGFGSPAPPPAPPPAPAPSPSP